MALGVLVRRYGDFAACEDAVQEALIAASTRWPSDGLPTNPTGWLITTSSRRLIEIWRNEAARRRREIDDATRALRLPLPATAADDSLALLLLCCHPALTPPSQVALTLRAVGGLTTAEIARAFLVPEATAAQRISRAKARLRTNDARFVIPSEAELADRLPSVLQVLYLIFNEGYAPTSGPSLSRVDLTTEAIRLTRQLHDRLPREGEVAGLLALLLLTEARRPARSAPDGALVPLADQDRRLWDRAAIAEGIDLVTATLPVAPLGPYQLQAAIAAVHGEAARAEDTDWPQILALYDLLAQLTPGPMVTLNRIVAVAMVRGARVALDELDRAADDPLLREHHRADAVRAHLLEMLGESELTREYYLRAARKTLSLPEQRYLLGKATARRPVTDDGPGGGSA